MLGLCVVALVLSPGQAVTLRYAPEIGKTYRYHTVMDITMDMGGMVPTTMHQDETIAMTANARKGNGTEVTVVVEAVKVTVPKDSPMASSVGMIEKRTRGLKSTMVIGKDGRPQSMGSGTDPMVAALGQGMQGMQGVIFPNHPVKSGDTWSVTFDLGKLMSGMGTAAGAGGGLKSSGSIPIVMKLGSVTTRPVFGRVASLTMTMGGTMSMSAMGRPMKVKMSTAASQTIEVASGMLTSMKSTSNSTTDLGQGKSMKQHVVMQMIRTR